MYILHYLGTYFSLDTLLGLLILVVPYLIFQIYKFKKIELLLEKERMLVEVSNEKLKLLQQIDHAILTTKSTEDALIDNILQALVKNTNWKVAIYWEHDKNQQHLFYKKSFILSEVYKSFVESSEKQFFKIGVGLPGRVLQSHSSSLIRDVVNDNNFPRKNSAIQTNLHGAASIPVIYNNDIFGIIEFFDTTPINEHDPKHINDLNNVGKKIGEAVHHLKNSNELLENKNHTKQLLTSINKSAIVTITDKFGKIIFVNEAFEKISGYESSEVIGKDHRILNSGFHDKAFFKNMWCTISEKNTWNGEIKNISKSGSYYWVYSSITPIFDTDGNIESIISIRFDITEQKSLSEKIQQQAQLSSLGEMAGSIAHEINNPLAIISAKTHQISQILNSGPLDKEKLQEYIASIEKTTLRISKIIRGLKNISRDGETDPFESISTVSLIDEVFDLCQMKMKNHNIDIKKVFDVKNESSIECRQVQIGQVLLNLLNNSFDAIDNTPSPWIKLEILEDTHHIKFKVSNSGAKIPESIQKKLFQPFFTTKKVGHGTGLGLSISKRIIEDHHGSISIDDSNPHTCFVVILPKKQTLPDKLNVA